VRLPPGFEPTRARGLAAPFLHQCAHLLQHFTCTALPLAAELELPPFAFLSVDGRIA
jgi:hypothetical protein